MFIETAQAAGSIPIDIPAFFMVGIAGLISGLLSDTGAGNRAAELQVAAIMEGIEEMRRQFNITQENINPNIDAGHRLLPQAEEAASLEGLDQRLKSIMSGEAFQGLLEERRRAVEARDAASGNFGSGAGLRNAANLPTELALLLEALSSDRTSNLVTGGQNAAIGLGGIGANTATNIASSFNQIGEARSSGSLADSQAKAERNRQFIRGGKELLDGIASGGISKGLDNFASGFKDLFF